jgi:glycosyltransferase involved in cell wall biosynthesis
MQASSIVRLAAARAGVCPVPLSWIRAQRPLSGSGTPVIASDIPALVEVVGGAGLHVPLSVPALARARERVAKDRKLRAELSAHGLERSRAFSWKRSAELHLQVYREASQTPV